ncbi:TIGR02117 family protein [Sphingomonas sp. Leaf231]|uniref:TIGR02117 family protein n=1 Tax=Sphingomonas sp. Leaf231 TaxID=1736301 RepID=UPI0009E7CF52|nr:TIGR02117 family protein [Sphingomonas sp. Leaf231]
MGAGPVTRTSTTHPVGAIVRAAGRVAAAMLALGGAYVLAALLLSAIPRNAGWVAPAAGVMIWVEDNGVHTGIVMPKRAAGVDWTGDFPARDLPDPRYAAHDHVAVGWGERHFYLGTPTWSDVRLATVLRAALGSPDTLLHVEHVPRPTTGEHVRAVTLQPQEYHRLVATIRASRGMGAAIPGYARYDAFYPGTGRYDALHTCNAWTGDTLADSGVRIGWWTPFSGSVMRWLPRG